MKNTKLYYWAVRRVTTYFFCFPLQKHVMTFLTIQYLLSKVTSNLDSIVLLIEWHQKRKRIYQTGAVDLCEFT